jgi:hypothetical protein
MGANPSRPLASTATLAGCSVAPPAPGWCFGTAAVLRTHLFFCPQFQLIAEC